VPSVMGVAFWTAKRGNREDEWEDSFALDEAFGRFAVADGASSSSKAAMWAAALTHGFLADPFDVGSTEAFDSWVARRSAQFELEHPPSNEEDVTPDNWYAHAASRDHGFATFVGVQFGETSSGSACRWIGVGDACLFHVRGGVLVHLTPNLKADDFGTFPDLISTNEEHREQAVTAAFHGSSLVNEGDAVMLVSDALAEWALKTAETDPEVWGVLTDLDTTTFDRLVADLRDADEIVNDDVTFLRCQVMK